MTGTLNSRALEFENNSDACHFLHDILFGVEKITEKNTVILIHKFELQCFFKNDLIHFVRTLSYRFSFLATNSKM